MPRNALAGNDMVMGPGWCYVDTPLYGAIAARARGRNAGERNAIVIDRFFDTKQDAVTWAKANPDFMIVQVCTPDAEADSPASQLTASVTD